MCTPKMRNCVRTRVKHFQVFIGEILYISVSWGTLSFQNYILKYRSAFIVLHLTNCVSAMILPPGKLTLIVFALSLSGSFHNGFLTIIPNTAAGAFQDFLNVSFYAHHGIYLEHSDFHYLWPLFLNLVTIGGFIGSLMIEPLAEKLGRKKSFYVVVTFQLVGCLASALSYFANSWELLSMGRLLSGKKRHIQIAKTSLTLKLLFTLRRCRWNQPRIAADVLHRSQS